MLSSLRLNIITATQVHVQCNVVLRIDLPARMALPGWVFLPPVLGGAAAARVRGLERPNGPTVPPLSFKRSSGLFGNELMILAKLKAVKSVN